MFVVRVGPFHVFSAAMFFSFQLVNNPDQPGARMLRQNIHRALNTLEQCAGMPVAEKALAILRCLAPLYDDRYLNGTKEERERVKAEVLPRVRTLAFPYHDSQRGSRPGILGESPRVMLGAVSPASGSNPSDDREVHDPRRQHQVVRFDSNGDELQQQRNQQPPMMPLLPPGGHNQNGAMQGTTATPSATHSNAGQQQQHPGSGVLTQSKTQLPSLRWAPVQGDTYPVTAMNSNNPSSSTSIGSSRTVFMPANGELTSPSASSHHASHHHHHQQHHASQPPPPPPPPEPHHHHPLSHTRESEHHEIQHGLGVPPTVDSWRHHQVQTLLHLQGYHNNTQIERDPDPNDNSSQVSQQHSVNMSADPRSAGMAYGAPNMIGVGMGMGMTGAPPPPSGVAGMAGAGAGMEWGASSGFEQGEWALFFDGLDRSDVNRAGHARMSMGE